MAIVTWRQLVLYHCWGSLHEDQVKTWTMEIEDEMMKIVVGMMIMMIDGHCWWKKSRFSHWWWRKRPLALIREAKHPHRTIQREGMIWKKVFEGETCDC